MRTSKLQILFVIVLATLSCKTLEGQILPNGATVELLATGFNFTEGPVYDGEGSLYFANLYFSATPVRSSDTMIQPGPPKSQSPIQAWRTVCSSTKRGNLYPWIWARVKFRAAPPMTSTFFLAIGRVIVWTAC